MAEPREPRKLALLQAIPLAATACAIAGSIDAIAYLLFGKIFIANLTGNTVLFAGSLLARDWKQAGLRLGVVIAFGAGVLAAHALLRRLAGGRDRRIKLTALGIEFVFLITLALVPHPHFLQVVLLIVLAFAMGLQNDAFRSIGRIKLNTSFVTGDIEKLGTAIAESQIPGKSQEAGSKAVVFFSVWIAYAMGALLGAFGALQFPDKALWIPAGLTILAAVLVLKSPGQEG